MCPGPIVPPIFLPVILVISAFMSVGRGLKNVDEAIRANNLKLVEWVKKRNLKQHDSGDACFQLEEKSTISIEEIKTQLQQSSSEQDDNEELAKLLIQRCTARLEQQAYDLAKEDLVEALSLMKSEEEQLGGDQPTTVLSSSYTSFSNNFYLAEYLLGMCCYGKGEFQEAAHHYQKSIDHREHVESQLIDCENPDKELQALEEQFFSMQLEAKQSVDKAVSSLTRNWKYYSTSVSNFKKKAKNYYNHSLMLRTHKPVLKTKPNTLITLEMLYIRAGLSYYGGNYFSDALPYFTRAIELGEGYQSEHVESTYYNRGLCYYYLGELQLAVDDFTKSISLMPLLKQRDVVYIMRACTYGRMGMEKERKHDENKAFYVNPFTRPVPLFHLRLLNDDVVSHIMTFLETKQILVMSSLSRYSRGLVQKYLQENFIEISATSLLCPMEKKNSIVRALFLPKTQDETEHQALQEVLKHPLLVEYAKNLIVFSCIQYSYYGGNSFEKDVILNFNNLKRLAITDLSQIKNLLHYQSPTIEYLEIGCNSYKCDELIPLITTLHNLQHLVLPITFFTINPFEKCKKLEMVEYAPIDDYYIEYFKCENGRHPYDDSFCCTWKELEEMNESITFKERTKVRPLL